MKRSVLTTLSFILTCFLGLLAEPLDHVGGPDLKQRAEAALEKGIAFFHSINTHGGYVYNVTPDLSLRPRLKGMFNARSRSDQ